MPKNKKSWIDKKRADTYLVIHRNQECPTDIKSSTDGQKETVSKKKDYEEHVKYGVYFDDDYDYMQHLRSLDEVPVLEKAEKLVSSAASTNPVKPSLEFLDEDPSGRMEPDDGLEEVDPDIAAALEDDFDYDDPENELEDDFVISANTGMVPATSSTSHRLRNEGFDEDSEEESSEDDEESEDLASDEDRQEFPEDYDEPMDAGMSCIKDRTEEQRLIDDQFERLCEDYEDDKIGLASDEEEPEALIDPDSRRMKELVEERKLNNVELVLNNDDVARRFAEEEPDDCCERLEDVTIECSGPKRAKWDCETILSTYSNIYNKPCVIKEPSRKHKLKRFLKKADEDYAMEEVRSHVPPSSVARSKGETTEEKKARKALVKEQRKERRSEKKCNKLAFKEERRKRQSQEHGVSVKMAPLA